MSEEIKKHMVYLRAGDFDYLKGLLPGVTASAIVRQAVAKIVDSLRNASDDELLKNLTEVQINLPTEEAAQDDN